MDVDMTTDPELTVIDDTEPGEVESVSGDDSQQDDIIVPATDDGQATNSREQSSRDEASTRPRKRPRSAPKRNYRSHADRLVLATDGTARTAPEGPHRLQDE